MRRLVCACVVRKPLKTGFLAMRPICKCKDTMSYLCEYKSKEEKAKIRARYNQVPHLTQDTTWESDKNTRKHHIQESQDISPFQAGDHKAAMNRQDCMTDTKDKKRIHKRSTALERSVLFSVGLKLVSLYQPQLYFRCGSRYIYVWFA